ncbi:hypothetical protein U1Q18_020797 [Sarracenia purpurea var. burkii]
MDGGHMHGMSPPSATDTGMTNMSHHSSMMHMTFFWGKNAEILFSGWPGTRSGMYALALIIVFVLSVLVEWLSYSNLAGGDGSNRVATGTIQTLVHAVRIGLAYMVMLALMSFNAGVFLVAVAGHAVGFFFFGSRAFKKAPTSSAKTSDERSMGC